VQVPIDFTTSEPLGVLFTALFFLFLVVFRFYRIGVTLRHFGNNYK
jgi:hypothetical protein